ncbi:MAG: glycosyltransferase family 9 protein [Selenomonadaceae bacterium]|nr:glycosyltransferase family 9 protein [Selenomonadaceae bacterium]
MNEDLKNVLIVKLSAMGDVIHALPVSYAIKETFPEAKVTWVVEPPSLPLLEMNPCVDKIILFNKKNFRTLKGFMKEFFPFKHELQEQSYDAVLDLQGLFKSAAIAFFAKSNIKLGICNMRELSDKISKPVVGENAEGHIVERYLDTARAVGCVVNEVRFPIQVPVEQSEKARAIMEHAGIREGNPYVIFAVGANWPNKRWPTDNFAALGDWFYQLAVIPVLVGSGDLDEMRAKEIEAKMEIPPINLINRTNIPQLAHVIRSSRLVIGGDTGPVHMGAALGVRTIMLMGPTNVERNGPFGQLEHAIEVERPCKGCWKRFCPKKEDCLEKIPVSFVEDKIKSMG